MSTDFKYLALTAILTASLWIPYVVAQVSTNGPLKPQNYLDPTQRPLPMWGKRDDRVLGDVLFLASARPCRRISARHSRGEDGDLHARLCGRCRTLLGSHQVAGFGAAAGAAVV